MYEYIIHNDASADIRCVLSKNRLLGLKIAKTVDELRADQDAMDRLTQRDWGGSPSWPKPRHATFNTGAWVEAQDSQLNLWRLRFFDDDLAGFRFIHAFFPANNRYVLLAVVEKAEFGMIHDERFNYELKHPTSQRIAYAYKQLVEEYW